MGNRKKFWGLLAGIIALEFLLFAVIGWKLTSIGIGPR